MSKEFEGDLFLAKPTSNKKKMTGHIKKPHTDISTGPIGCGITHLVLDLIESECKKHFEYYKNIFIICPTLSNNTTYLSRNWVKNDNQDNQVWLVEPGDRLYEWIKKLSQLLRRLEVLFIIDDLIADECLDKKRQPILELSFTGRHQNHYFWLLTQSYTAFKASFQGFFCVVSKREGRPQENTRGK